MSVELKKFFIQSPYISWGIVLFMFIFMPIFIWEIPTPPEFSSSYFYLNLFFSIFLTTSATFGLSTIILRDRYISAYNSLKKETKGKLNHWYVYAILGITILYLLPLIFFYGIISDFSLGLFGFAIGILIGFYLSLKYLERPFHHLEKEGVILYIPILKNELIFTTKGNIPAVALFEIYSEKFEKIKICWFRILGFLIMTIIIQILHLYTYFVNYYKLISYFPFIHLIRTPEHYNKLIILGIYNLIYVPFYIACFVLPNKKIKNFYWILKEFQTHLHEIKNDVRIRV